MKQLVFYFDFISPYAWMAFARLPVMLEGHSYSVTYKPVVLGAVLSHHGQLGPAEIPVKRDWTYRQTLWLGHSLGVELQFPARHPFNPLALLRLAVACSANGLPNRYVTEQLFRHVWCSGADAVDPQRLTDLTELLAPARDPQSSAVKTELRSHTDDALAKGLFGVPTMEVDGRLFWGLDALPMLRAYLDGDGWFASGAWDAVGAIPAGVSRKRD
ncbi:MAG: 2-hydroxychromene-2-carboxylate isomerase [Burkholderiaceae bacterium]